MKELVKFIDSWDSHYYSEGDIGYLLEFVQEDGDLLALVRLVKTRRGSSGKVGHYVTASLNDIKYIGDKDDKNEKIL